MSERQRLKLWLGAGFALIVGCGDGPIITSEPTPNDQTSSPEAPSGAAGSGTKPQGPYAAGKGSTQRAGAGGSAASAESGRGSTAGSGGDTAPVVPTEPLGDTTDFVSADTQGASRGSLSGGVSSPTSPEGTPGRGPTAPPTQTPAPGAGADANGGRSPRAVERGDIYRVLGDQRILNLNAYRGVQILDVSDVAKPRVEGRLAVSGDPVELYLVNDRAIVLLNNWHGYYGTRDDVQVESVQGGLVLTVDVSDRRQPKLVAQLPVAGSISTSRLTQDGTQAALYVASTSYTNNARTVVTSLDVSGDRIVKKTELDLGGYVQDIQATTDLLLVASTDWERAQGRSTVSVIDISQPDGTMVRGGSVLVQGLVQNKFNMDAYNGVLRVVSSASGGGALTNHLQTFSLANLQQLEQLDDCTFGRRDPQSGQSETLFATLFLENRAFFVTYFRTDPFHAFSVDDAGQCAEHNEFIVTGWNDFFRATLNDTRLVGIGHNDANNARRLSVSLYDATDLTNTEPLLARADIELEGAYSEASWDDRGFSVLEGAVSAKATDGTTETGLILLPFGGWDSSKQDSVARVQIFTFSDHTLTKRGSMDHGTPVQRSFQVKAQTTANLSQQELSLFDTVNPDQPRELGRVDIAPNYSQVFVFGEHIARVREDLVSYYYVARSNQSQEPPRSQVQILARSADIDGMDVLASFEVPAGSQLSQVGSLLVSVYTLSTVDSTGQKVVYQSKIQVFDLADPQKPQARGSLETDRLVPYYGGVSYPAAGGPPPVVADCFDCRFYPRASAQSFVVGDALAFIQGRSQSKSEGLVTQCYLYPSSVACPMDPNGKDSCMQQKYYSGGVTCTTPQGGKESCTGQFYLCDAQGCEPVDPPDNSNRQCSTFTQFRYWTAYAIDPLDLRDPAKPVLAPRVELPADEEGTSVIAVDKTLYVNYQKPHTQPNDTRRYVKRFVHLIDFADPAKPAVDAGINVPGDIIAAQDTTLYARDIVWADTNTRTLVTRLRLNAGAAHRQASRLFEDRSVSAVKLDGAGHVLVSSDPAYVFTGRPVPTTMPGVPVDPATTPKSKLSMLDAVSLEVVGEADVDHWATFQDAQRGRALYQVSGGLLVFDVQDAAHPKAQAYFPTAGWPRQILFDGEWILFAAGQYGVYRFDADEFNLLSK